MSKAIGTILTVVGVAALAVVTAGAALGVAAGGTIGQGIGFAAAGLSSLTGITISSAVLTSAALVGLSAITTGGPPAVRAETTESARKSPTPARTRAYGRMRLFGDWILFSNKADGTPVDVWAFHDGQASSIFQVYLNDDKVTLVGGVVQALADGRYGDSRLLCGYNMGLPIETAFPIVVDALPGIWTEDHRGDDVVTGYLIKQLTKSDKFLKIYPNGDDIQMSLAGEWTRVFDFREPAQDAYDPTTWAYSDNPVLALLHYLITQYAVDFDTQILPQIDYWEAAADDCDELMSLDAGGTEKRYRLALAYKATQRPAAVIAAILATFDGWYIQNEKGEYIVYSGRYQTPTVTIGPDKIVSHSVQRHVPAEDAVNEVLVTFVSEAHEFSTVDAESWRDQAAIDASGREPVSQPLEAQVPSPTQGRRLAKRKMLKANAPRRGSIVTTYGGREALGQRYVNLNIVEAGATFYNGPAEVIGSPERDPQTGGLTFEWIAISEEIDDWDPETEDGTSAPVGETPDIDPLDDPVITSALFFGGDNSGEGTSGARVRITITAPDREDLTWFARWRVVGASVWNTSEYDDIDPGASVVLETGFVPVNSDIEVEVKYEAGDGRASDWSAAVVITTGSVSFDSTEVSFDSTTVSWDRI